MKIIIENYSFDVINFLKINNILYVICTDLLDNHYQFPLPTNITAHNDANAAGFTGFINDYNLDLVKHLSLIGYMYDLLKDIYRAKVYKEASKNISKLIYTLTLDNYKDVSKIKGIGPSITATVKEFLETGTSERLEEITAKSKPSKVIKLFTTIYGIGTVKAQKLYDLGYRTLEDLLNNPQDLTHAQIGYIKYYDDLSNKINRDILNNINKYLTILLKDYKWEMVGSYRRGFSSSSDIDILVTRKESPLKASADDILSGSLQDVIKKLRSLLVYTLAEGDTKYMGIMKYNGRAYRIDIRFVEEESWPYALLYFTGPKSFNIKMRNIAKELGYDRLNEYGLYLEDGTAVGTVENEEDIFHLLEMEYVEPDERY